MTAAKKIAVMAASDRHGKEQFRKFSAMKWNDLTAPGITSPIRSGNDDLILPFYQAPHHSQVLFGQLEGGIGPDLCNVD